jgi:hypothetical protein
MAAFSTPKPSTTRRTAMGKIKLTEAVTTKATPAAKIISR